MFFQSRRVLICAMMLCIVCLSGCQLLDANQTSKPAPALNKTSKNSDQLSLEHIDRINLLLSDAFLAFQDDRLTTPVEENAYLIYMQVLSIDPDNNYANLGLTEIAEKYLDWALTAAEQKNYRKASDFLNKARSIDDTNPNIDAVNMRIEESKLAKQLEFKLPIPSLQDRSDTLVVKLQEIAQKVEEHDASVVIAARSDKEGRWIYKQLNDATNNRVKATFLPANIPFVRVLYP